MITPNIDVDLVIGLASSLSERLNATFPDPAPDGEERVTKWQNRVAEGEPACFDARLEWQSLDRESARMLLNGIPRFAPGREPFWANTLRCLIEHLTVRASGGPNTVEWSTDVPFGQALQPFVDFAITRLRAEHSQISEIVIDSLREDILKRLFAVASLTLGEEFLRERKRAGVLEELLASPAAGKLSTKLYREFVDRLHRGGWLKIFESYPALARLLAITIQFWIADTAVFLTCYATDAGKFAARFFQNADPGPLTHVEGTASDLHHCGRAVKILTFANGKRLVFKPKSLAVDLAWNNLLDWLKARSAALSLRKPDLWTRDTYGWVEFIEYKPCDDWDEVRRFYRNAGAVACLFYFLRGTDFHHENIIANGEHCIAIDMETLLAHVPALVGGSIGINRLFDTVLQSGMMPNWEVSGKTAFDISALGTFAKGQVSQTGAEWKFPNTDHMHLGQAEVALEQSHNMPRLPSVEIDAGNFVSEIVHGFRETFFTLCCHREDLLAADGPLTAFAHLKVRVVLRPTGIYSRLLQCSVIPRLLRNGVDRSLEFEGLSRHTLFNKETHGCRHFFFGELDALERGDIPYFEAATSGNDVLTEDGAVSRGLLDGSSFQAVVRHVRSLTPDDCDWQTELIQGAFQARSMRFGGMPQFPFVSKSNSPGGPGLASEELISEARFVFEQLKRRALRGEAGAAYWIALQPLLPGGIAALQPTDSSLYSGLAGIAIFLAAFYAVTGDPEARSLADGAIQSLLARVLPQRVPARTAKSLALLEGIGGGSGLGGVIYALSVAAELLRDSRLLEKAFQLSAHLTPEIIIKDRTLDVMGGVSGAMHGLLALWRRLPESVLLQHAAGCAEHLLAQRISHAGFQTWKTVGELPLTGMSHGASGIAYALLRLHAVQPDSRFAAAAMESIRFERSVHSAEKQNWPDYRAWTEGQPLSFSCSWCHGAPGIGLARLGSLGMIEDNNLLLEDARAALACADAEGAQEIDSVCCGEFGLTELLLEGERLLAGGFYQSALRRASRLVRAAQQRRADTNAHGYLFGSCLEDRRFNIGFFQGLAGVGYSLLRLAEPGRLPCVVRWE